MPVREILCFPVSNVFEPDVVLSAYLAAIVCRYGVCHPFAASFRKYLSIL
ncbi:hypothetical protein EVA_20159 [gut metagenome]|uniref:Uncharacterized protein n=1 Tax=gut metagenome TaxID=749906 RepID=J9FWL0_9ZZZZ